MTADLHLHTFYSDGQFSPAEIVTQAASMGLEAIAITDHDNTNGVREALLLAQEVGLELVPAIELTCTWDQCRFAPGKWDIDVLGYFIDLNHAGFRAFEQAVLADIHARVKECCTLLTAAGYPLSLADLFAKNPRYAGLMQVSRTMMHKGYAEDWDAAYKPMAECWEHVRRSSFDIRQTIEQIHQAGGVAILAHPVAVKSDGAWLTAAQMAQLVEMGLDGLEIYHRAVDEEQAHAHFLALAEQFDLLISGGSDFHGWFGGFERMGTQPVTMDMVAAIRGRSNG